MQSSYSVYISAELLSMCVFLKVCLSLRIMFNMHAWIFSDSWTVRPDREIGFAMADGAREGRRAECASRGRTQPRISWVFCCFFGLLSLFIYSLISLSFVYSRCDDLEFLFFLFFLRKKEK